MVDCKGLVDEWRRVSKRIAGLTKVTDVEPSKELKLLRFKYRRLYEKIVENGCLGEVLGNGKDLH